MAMLADMEVYFERTNHPMGTIPRLWWGLSTSPSVYNGLRENGAISWIQGPSHKHKPHQSHGLAMDKQSEQGSEPEIRGIPSRKKPGMTWWAWKLDFNERQAQETHPINWFQKKPGHSDDCFPFWNLNRLHFKPPGLRWSAVRHCQVRPRVFVPQFVFMLLSDPRWVLAFWPLSCSGLSHMRMGFWLHVPGKQRAILRIACMKSPDAGGYAAGMRPTRGPQQALASFCCQEITSVVSGLFSSHGKGLTLCQWQYLTDWWLQTTFLNWKVVAGLLQP